MHGMVADESGFGSRAEQSDGAAQCRGVLVKLYGNDHLGISQILGEPLTRPQGCR